MRLLIVLLLLVMPVIGIAQTLASQSGTAPASPVYLEGTLKRVETLTDSEKKELADAIAAVNKANQALLDTRYRIAGRHKMSQQSYMEWSSWYEFDGDFILQRFQSNMASSITTGR